MTINSLFNEWLYQNHSHQIKNGTLMRYECTIKNYISPFFGDLSIENVTPRDIQSLVNSMLSSNNRLNHQMKPSTINGVLAVLNMGFNYAVDFEILEKSPMRKIRNIPMQKPCVTALSRDQQHKLENYITASNNPELFVYVLVLYTGLRLGEVCALTWRDIDLRTGVIDINKAMKMERLVDNQWKYVTESPKTKTSVRTVPIPSFLNIQLRYLKKTSRSKFVVSKEDGSFLEPRTVAARLKSIYKKLALKGFTFHSLRHTYATRCLEMNIDIKTISDVLGHSNASTTLNIYTHSLNDHKKRILHRMKRV